MREIVELVISEIRGAWRFRWYAVLVAWVACLVGWAFVYVMPDSYESEATLLFNTNSDLTALLGSMTVNADELSQVEVVRTALLGFNELEQVARKTDLHLRASDDSIESVVAGLRSRISITTGSQRGASIYRLRYRDPQPDKAYAVVNTLLENFVSKTAGANREGTERAQQFLRSELQKLENDLTTAEQRLADFKRENVGRMPGERGDYFSRLQAEMDALEATRTELRQARRERNTLQEQLAGERPTVSQDGEPTTLDIRIAENQRRLEELQLRFTDRHPDVIAVKETLDQLRAQRARQLERLESSDGMSVASDNPVFQNIQIELARVNVAIASLEEREATHRQKIAELQELVDVLPQIEAELSRLNRDYDVKRAQYQALLQRLEVAELSESADESEDVRFQIINPPLVPREPVAPDRPRLLTMVLIAGLLLGGGLGFLGNQLKPVFTDPQSVRAATGLPVLGTVGILDSKARSRQRVWELSSLGGAVVALCVVFVFAVWFHELGSDLVRAFT